jgi:hypothetical protein
LFIIIIGRERNADFSTTNGRIVFKILTSFISGSCSHPRCADYFLYSVRQKDAFPSVECLSLEEALSGVCTGNATAFMGDDIRFE